MIIKHGVLVAAALSAMAFLSGCVGGRAQTNFTPPDGFTMKSRNKPDVNLFFVLDTENLTPGREMEMRTAVEHYFRKSNRFHVYWKKASNIDEDIVVTARFALMPVKGSSVSGMGARVSLTAMCNHLSGRGNDSLRMEGFSKPEYARNRFAKPMSFSEEKHFTDALNDALRKLQRDIERLYPISSRVENFYCGSNGRAEFTISIGTNHGLSSRYEYLVCCKLPVGYAVIGLATGVPGNDFTQIRVVDWNRDATDFPEIYERIKNNDKSLVSSKSLFVIARLKARK